MTGSFAQVLSDADRADMARALGVATPEALFDRIPADLRIDTLSLPPALPEWALARHMAECAQANVSAQTARCYLGAGCYDHHVPAAVDTIAERGEFLTAYTPYQPELSQGLLKTLDIYATKIAALTGLPVVTSSHYDAVTALADACWMAGRATGRGRILMTGGLFPHYRRVLDTYAWARGLEFIDWSIDPESSALAPVPEVEDISAVVVQTPNAFGVMEDLAGARAVADRLGAKLIVLANPIFCALGVPLGRQGVDIAVLEGQPMGVHMFAGGAHIGILACREDLRHLTPGRLVGRVSDIYGRQALALVYEDREQHVARERATSNICSNQALNALRVGAYLTLMGGAGVAAIAQAAHANAAALFAGLAALPGVRRAHTGAVFNEAAIDFTSNDARKAVQTRAEAAGIWAGVTSADHPGLTESQLLIAVTETKSGADLAQFVTVAAAALGCDAQPGLAALQRGGDPLELGPAEHPNLQPLPEVEVIRLYTNLSRESFGVDTGTYPLGSCTMKYNPKRGDAAAEQPGFRALHPFQPAETLAGLRQIYTDLADHIGAILGFSAVDLTPAAGAHGEFRGLTIARRYFEDRNERRDEVIVPDSAHGTNPATAAMVGYKTRIIPTRGDGLMDTDALRRAVSDRTAVVMMTNPSTFGLFETEIAAIVEAAHGAGALMYYDGANMNALMGHTNPGRMGFDMAHINVHKTLGTPHGGGGPGAGPVGVRAALARYISPGFRGGDDPLPIKVYGGHVSVLLRAYAYIRSLGAEGLKQVSTDAVLNANYLAHVLAPVLPKMFAQHCMHEVLLDGGKLPCTTLDLSKRMIDFGVHPPTLVGAGCVYFGEEMSRAMLFEPTETETKANLDRLADIIARIAAEAEASPDIAASAPHSTPTRRLVVTPGGDTARRAG
ncbi:MAG: aminomethyl-transferring glycine dehydrogenase subunit GcvPB [Pseudomonadota bacterium]